MTPSSIPPLTAALYASPPPEPFAAARTHLRRYEGARVYVWFVAGAALCIPFAAVPLGALALSVFVVHEGIAAYGVGLVSLCASWLPGWAYKVRLWERPLRARLAWRTAFDPSVARVSVNLVDKDLVAAVGAICRAGLVIEYMRTSGCLGADARNTNIAVAQWAHHARLGDFAFRDQVGDVLRRAAICANVGGIEIGPRMR